MRPRISSRSPGSISTLPTASSPCCSSCCPDAGPTRASAPSSTAAPGADFGPLERSPELEREFDQYRRRGRLPFLEEAPLLVQKHSALLQALGHEAGEGPLALAADPREVESAGAAFAAKAQAALHVAPPYGAWLGEMLGA